MVLVLRIDRGPDDRPRHGVARQGRPGVRSGRDGVSHGSHAGFFDARDDIADFPGREALHRFLLRHENADFQSLEFPAGNLEFELVALADLARKDPDENDDAPVSGVLEIEYQRTERRAGFLLRRRNAPDNFIKQVFDAFPGLS